MGHMERGILVLYTTVPQYHGELVSITYGFDLYLKNYLPTNMYSLSLERSFYSTSVRFCCIKIYGKMTEKL